MNNTLKMTLFWVLAVIITLSAATYQRLTGPTHPKRVSLNIDETEYKLKLVRSHGGETDCPLEYELADDEISGTLSYKRYPTKDEWQKVELKREGNKLTASLPNQPPAGKIEYKLEFFKNEQLLNNPDVFHVIIRFKGAVPSGILFPHVLLMFLAMLVSNLSGILAIARHRRMVLYTNITLAFLIIGGMIFGPIMQLYAFGELWTGFPFGKDFTDNKTLLALIFWIIAAVLNRKQQKPVWILIASIVMLAIYMVPHSMGGSELDYEAGKIVTG